MIKTINCLEQPHEAIHLAKEILLREGVICVPTETVYGLIALPTQNCIQKIVHIKGRPDNKPFALFVSSLKRIQQEDIMLPDRVEKLISNYWPGPLTIVLNAGKDCPYHHQGSIGLRCPNYPIIHEILDQTGGLLVNTSLNKSGNPPIWDLNEADESLQEVDLILDAGRLSQQAPSTVIDCRNESITVIREGAISKAELEKFE